MIEDWRAARRRQREAWRDRPCAVCGILVYREAVMIDYMATDAAWAAAGLGPHDLACLGCFETRLGVPLAEVHLADAVVSRTIRWLLRQGLTPWRQRTLY